MRKTKQLITQNREYQDSFRREKKQMHPRMNIGKIRIDNSHDDVTVKEKPKSDRFHIEDQVGYLQILKGKSFQILNLLIETLIMLIIKI